MALPPPGSVSSTLREGKVVTAVDDHSRYCVIATVAERATSRVVCLALAEALFDKVCRHNGITHQMTAVVHYLATTQVAPTLDWEWS